MAVARKVRIACGAIAENPGRGHPIKSNVFPDLRGIVVKKSLICHRVLPTHVLIVPKKHIVGVNTAKPEDAELIGYSHLIAAKIGRDRGIEDGYRTCYNVGPRSGQSVFHLHLHLIGGRDMAWPPG